MKVLVVGKGGREHALVTAIAESPTPCEIFAFPGSDAILRLATPVEADGLHGLVDFVKRQGIDLVVAGEESYLVKDEGLANLCAEAGIACWGPRREAARLEASKEFAKEFLVRHNIPTGGYRAVSDADEARAAADSFPCVLKFDGLAAGKGVAICQDRAAAEAFIDEVFTARRFGDGRMLVEEFLEGPEISIFASVVDDRYQILCPARDYKRIGDGDTGPNTGGMGAVASRHLVDASLMERIEREIVRPTVDGLVRDGLPYRGFLYFGLMLTESGPRVLEYNCRFGDPECEAVMPLVRGDFMAYLDHAARGELREDLIRFDEGWSVCVILASAGYPVTSRSGDRIRGLDEIAPARVYHAGTKRSDDGGFETAGGRVLAVVATGQTRHAARDAAYGGAARIAFDGMQRRADIGLLHFE